MADDMTPGEIARTFQRQAEDIRAVREAIVETNRKSVPLELWAAEHKALQDVVADLKRDISEGFSRVEATSLDRRRALQQKDADLEKKIDAVEKKIKEERARAESEESRGSQKTANWIAAIVGLVALIGVIVTLIGQGGH